MGFNERDRRCWAAAASDIPLISCVGHETDLQRLSTLFMTMRARRHAAGRNWPCRAATSCFACWMGQEGAIDPSAEPGPFSSRSGVCADVARARWPRPGQPALMARVQRPGYARPPVCGPALTAGVQKRKVIYCYSAPRPSDPEGVPSGRATQAGRPLSPNASPEALGAVSKSRVLRD